MQRGDDPRVSEPVLETLEIARPTIRFASTGQVVGANVERETALAYEQHTPKLRAFAIAALRDGEAADDIIQEVFLRLIVELKAGRKPNNVGGWLYRAAANLIVSRGRRRTIADRMRAFLVRRDVEPSPEDEALRSEQDRTLALALSNLAPDARVALLLAARGMGSAEIGLVIHRSPTATRSYLCRARVRLRDELAALGLERER